MRHLRAVLLVSALVLASIGHAAENRYAAVERAILALPAYERPWVLYAAWQDVNREDQKLSLDTPKQRVDVLKIMATESSMLASFAKGVCAWPELGDILNRRAQFLASVIRGETPREGMVQKELEFFAEAKALAKERQSAMAQQAGNSQLSPGFAKAREDLQTLVVVMAKYLVWEKQKTQP